MTLRLLRRTIKRFHSRLVSFSSRLVREETAQGTVEYIVILSVAVVGSVQLMKQILKSLDAGILRLGGQLEQSPGFL